MHWYVAVGIVGCICAVEVLLIVWLLRAGRDCE